MSINTTHGRFDGALGGFSIRLAALAALVGLALGLALVQSQPWQGGDSDSVAPPAVAVSAPPGAVTSGPMHGEMAITDGAGRFFTEAQVQAAQSAAVPVAGAGSIIDPAQVYLTGSDGAVGRGGATGSSCGTVAGAGEC